MGHRLSVLGISIDNLSLVEAAESIVEAAKQPTRLTRFAFVNADCLNIGYRNPEYTNVLDQSDFVFGDGSGVRYGCALTGQNIIDNVNGTDLYPLLCEYAIRDGLSIYLLGGRPGIAESAAARTQQRYPELSIAGTNDGYFDHQNSSDVIRAINESGADILLVAMGAPYQEMWIAEHTAELRVGAAIGVGGLLDFVANKVSRAPNWVRWLGLEWIVRFLNEPFRLLNRYLVGNPLFIWRVIRSERKNVPQIKVTSGATDFRKEGSLFDPWQDFEVLKKVEHKYENLSPGKTGANTRRTWTYWRLTRGYKAVKRIIDLAISLFLLFALIPLFIVTASLIYMNDPGPVLFKQLRVGYRGKKFSLLKFRSMYVDAEARKDGLLDQNESNTGVLFKMKLDPRITRVGKYIRRFSIDELPQLINVMRGEMSLVGPRPPLPTEVDEYALADRRRLEAKPGITCIWQVSGRSEIPFNDQVELDVRYIENRSLRQDILLLLKTIPAVCSAKGAY